MTGERMKVLDALLATANYLAVRDRVAIADIADHPLVAALRDHYEFMLAEGL